MTIGELIAELSKLDPSVDVQINVDGFYGGCVRDIVRAAYNYGFDTERPAFTIRSY